MKKRKRSDTWIKDAMEKTEMLKQPEDEETEADLGFKKQEIILHALEELEKPDDDEMKIKTIIPLTNQGFEKSVSKDKSLLTIFLKDMERYPLLSGGEEAALASDPEKETKLVLHNLRLVVSWAKRMSYRLNGNRDTDLMDYIQEGYFGLVRAAEKFEFDCDEPRAKFSTYARWWIRQKILKYAHDNGRTIRIPAYINTLLIKLKKTETRLRQELGRKSTDEELAQMMALEVKKIRALKSLKDVVSLSSPIGNGEDLLEQFIPDLSAKSPEEEIFSAENREKPWELAEKAFARIKNGKKMFYILIQRTERTLEDIGEELGVTREYVRQVETKALKHLRRPKWIKEFEKFR